MADQLANALYKSIRDANEDRVFEQWHASSIAECPRAHYFKRLGIKSLSNPGAGKMLRWQAGHIIEGVIRPHLEKVFEDLESNVRLESELLDLTGEYDNYSEDAETIIEIKSVNERAFAYRKVADTRYHLRDQKPYLNHELQNHCYVKLLREKGKPVSFITYVYITLDGRIATYKTPVNLELEANVTRRLELLNTAWKAQQPPECICSKEDHPLYKSTMQFCDYKGKDGCCSLSLITNK